MANSDIYNLEYLSLVSKITQEIDNHTGINDKVLAEFVISLHDQANKSLIEFKDKLKSVGADFPDSFIENVDRLILSMHPKHKKKVSSDGEAVPKGDGELTEQEKKKRMFPGLSLKDHEQEAVSDDVFLKELGDLVSGKKRPSQLERSPKRQRRDRSPSPRRRTPSPVRGRDHDRRGRNARPFQDERPILFKIYSGRVSGLKDFGAFVTLEGVAGRVEGVCSLYSNILLKLIVFRHGSCIQYTDWSTSELRIRFA